MKIIDVNMDNIELEHICCSISEKSGENSVGTKKEWMKKQFLNGLVFKKLNVRGKVLIEYMPAENAFVPIEAYNYMYINCFWVSGKYKGLGHGKSLLAECINDAKAKGKDGLVILTSDKKRPFLSDPKFLKYNDFLECDESMPYFKLMYLPFKENSQIPKFKNCAKSGIIDEQGVVIYYSNQCPHTEKYVHLVKDIAVDNNIPIKIIKFESANDAQNSPSPFTTYSIFINGNFVTNEILSEKKFIQIIEDYYK